MILIRFFGEVGENYPKVTEVSIQWLNEMKCPLNLRNKIALCLNQENNMTRITEGWEALTNGEVWFVKSPQKGGLFQSPVCLI